MDVGTIQHVHVSKEIDCNAATEISVPSYNVPATNVFDSDGGHVTNLTTKAPCMEVRNLASFDKHYKVLNEEQQQIATFLKDWKDDGTPHLLLISGAPGTGKTFAVIETLNYFKGSFVKMAYTNQIAKSIGGRTIHSRLKINYKSKEPHSISDVTTRMLRNEYILDTSDYVVECHNVANELVKYIYPSLLSLPNVVVIDEIGLLPFWFTLSIVKYYGPVLFVMIGDEFQLKPVSSCFNIFSFPLNIPTTTIRLNLNNRFSPTYHDLIDQMRHYVTELKSTEMAEFLKLHFPVRDRIVESDYDHISLILAYTNESVNNFNMKILKKMDGELVQIPIKKEGKFMQHNALTLKPNCRIISLKETLLMAQNEEDYFSSYSHESDTVELMSGKRIRRDPYTGQFPIAPAYCFTIHKYQGQTIDRSGVVFHFDGRLNNLNLIYTALSRIRNMSQIYAVIL